MEGLLFTIAAVVALVAAVSLALRRRRPRPGPRRAQDHEPPGEHSPPDEWPRDGGGNPSAP